MRVDYEQRKTRPTGFECMTNIRCCEMCMDDIEELTDEIEFLKAEINRLRDALAEDIMELWKRVP